MSLILFYFLETSIVDRMHGVWQMKSDIEYINTAMINFLYDEIKCSSCQKLGLSNSILYSIPQFLLLKAVSDDSECINLINDVEVLFVRPSPSHPSFEYDVQTVLIVLEEDNIIYLRKSGRGYSSYNKTSGEFELLDDLPAQQTGLASRWTVFIYETNATIFELPPLEKMYLDQSALSTNTEPEASTIDVVLGLLPSFKKPFDVGSIELKPIHIQTLLDKNGDINDLIIDAHLLITASSGSSHYKILTVPSYLTRQIIDQQLKQMPTNWLDHEIILCPINQKHHWYLVILDLKRQLVIQLDSLLKHDLPRSRNITRLLHVLDIQHYFRNGTDINFYNTWEIATPNENLQQNDLHSCGINILVQAQAYVNHQKFVHITPSNTQLYRYKIAEDLLRIAEPWPDSDESYSSVRIKYTKQNVN